MYQPIKFDCKKISSSANMVETVTSDQIWLQKDQQFSKYGRNSQIWSNAP